MCRIALLILLLLASCNVIKKASYRSEESHNALYKQKALMVYAEKNNRVFLTNPTRTRCYFLQGKRYLDKWEPGDTMMIDENLDDFYNLKFARVCF
jgi:hypothetical protein